MQVNCPQCATRLQLSAANLPAHPFTIKCPKCQQGFTVSPAPLAENTPPIEAEHTPLDDLLDLDDKDSADQIAAAPPAPSIQPSPPVSQPEPQAKQALPDPSGAHSAPPPLQTDWTSSPSDLAVGWTNSMPAPTVSDDSDTLVTAHHSNYDLVQALASLLTSGSLTNPSARIEQNRRRMIVACLANPEDASTVQNALKGQDYELIVASSPDQVTTMLQTSHQLDILLLDPNFHAGQQGGASIMRYLNMLNPARRRRVFVVVTSHTYRTLDMQAAFVHGVNLVLNSNDLGSLPSALSKSIQEFNNLYRAFNEASGISSF